jgi:hypothetical protein
MDTVATKIAKAKYPLNDQEIPERAFVHWSSKPLDQACKPKFLIFLGPSLVAIDLIRPY